jgi:hypothetical protein
VIAMVNDFITNYVANYSNLILDPTSTATG